MPLKANVGLSRKLSKDYNSTGFSLNLEGEILATLDDSEAVVERVLELFSVAEEALDRKVSESQSTDALASHDAEDHRNGNGTPNGRPAIRPEGQGPAQNGKAVNGEPATNKQVQFLQTLAKRHKLIGPRLEAFLEEVVGHRCSAYDLTKKEAARVIDQLSGDGAQTRR